MSGEQQRISSALSRLLDLTPSIRFDSRNPQHVLAVCLYARIVELALGVSSLLHAGVPAAIPVLVRTQLEAFADFVNVITSPDHVGTLAANNLAQRIRILETALREDDPNPILVELAQHDRARDILAEDQERLRALAEAGYTPLGSRATFEEAGLLHEYEAIFWHLCLDSHNNMLALERHHLRQTDDHVEVCILQQPDLFRLSAPLDSALATAVHAHERLRQFLGIPIDDAFREVARVFKAVREQLPDAEL